MSSEIRIVRGDTEPLVLQFWSDRKSGIKYNLSDVTSATLTVDPEKGPVDATNNLFTLAGVISDPSSGLISFSPTEIHVDLPPATYYYDVQFIKVGGFKKTPIIDKFVVTQDINKS